MKFLFEDELPGQVDIFTVQKEINGEELYNQIQDKNNIDNWFDVLVPQSGKADTLAGELVRAMQRILYRDYNDGDRFFSGYGVETCGGSAQFLIENTNDRISDRLTQIAEDNLEGDEYSDAIEYVSKELLNYLNSNKEIIGTENSEDSREWKLAEEFIPKYDFDCELPPQLYDIIRYTDYSTQDLEGEIYYWEAYGGQIGNESDRISVDGYTLYIDGIEEDMYNDLEKHMYKWLEDFADELSEEYPVEDEEEESDDEDNDEDEKYLDEALENAKYGIIETKKFNNKNFKSFRPVETLEDAKWQKDSLEKVDKMPYTIFTIEDKKKVEESLHNDEIDQHKKISKEIGLKTLGDLKTFKDHQGSAELDALKDYKKELDLDEASEPKERKLKYVEDAKLYKVNKYDFKPGEKVKVKDSDKVYYAYIDYIDDDKVILNTNAKLTGSQFDRDIDDIEKVKSKEIDLDEALGLKEGYASWLCKYWPDDEEDRAQLDIKLRHLNLKKELTGKDAVIKGDKENIQKFMTWLGLTNNRFSEIKEESFKEGISGNMTVEEIAEKHKVPVEDIKKQLEIGVKVEKEHTKDEKKAERIALDHLFEIPNYYDKLGKMEKDALKEDYDIIDTNYAWIHAVLDSGSLLAYIEQYKPKLEKSVEELKEIYIDGYEGRSTLYTQDITKNKYTELSFVEKVEDAHSFSELSNTAKWLLKTLEKFNISVYSLRVRPRRGAINSRDMFIYLVKDSKKITPSYESELRKPKQEESLKEEIELDEISKLAEEINNAFEEENKYYDVYPYNDRLECTIENGDWKHDHLYFEHFIRDFLENKGYVVDINKEIIDESEDDSYSASYTISVTKDSLDEKLIKENSDSEDLENTKYEEYEYFIDRYSDLIIGNSFFRKVTKNLGMTPIRLVNDLKRYLRNKDYYNISQRIINMGNAANNYLNGEYDNDSNIYEHDSFVEELFDLEKNYMNEKLIQSPSKKALQKNIKTEIEAGKDPKQAYAIAKSIQNKNMKESFEDNEYIIEIGISTNVGWDSEKNTFRGSLKEVEEVFNERLEELIKETIENNSMNPEEAAVYREEVEDSSCGYPACNHVYYSEDPDDEWYILIDQVFNEKLSEDIEYDYDGAKNAEGIFDIASEQEVADIMKEPVIGKDKTYYPQIDLVREIKEDPDVDEYIAASGKKCYRVFAPLDWYLLKCEQAGLKPEQTDDFKWEAKGNGFEFDWVEEDAILALDNLEEQLEKTKNPEKKDRIQGDIERINKELEYAEQHDNIEKVIDLQQDLDYLKEEAEEEKIQKEIEIGDDESAFTEDELKLTEEDLMLLRHMGNI